MDDRVIDLLENILVSIQLIDEYLEGYSLHSFRKSVQLQDSVIRRLGIIGAAVNSIPLELQQQQLDIPWKEMARMRDIMTDHFSDVDLESIWKTIKEDHPLIKSQIEQLLDDLKE